MGDPIAFSGLCYHLLRLAGVVGLGSGALLPGVQGSWPLCPWVRPAAVGGVAAAGSVGTAPAFWE